MQRHLPRDQRLGRLRRPSFFLRFVALISAAEKTERQSRIISVLECLEKEDDKKRGWKFETVSGGGAEIRGQR